MYIHYSLGAIFSIFVLCVHCDNAVNYNEGQPIYVPSSPQNLTVIHVTAVSINLSWVQPTNFSFLPFYPSSDLHTLINPEEDAAGREFQKNKSETQADDPETPHQNVLHATESNTENQRNIENPPSVKDIYKNGKLKYNDQYSFSGILTDASYRSKRDYRHRRRRQESNETKINLESLGPISYQASDLPIGIVKKSNVNKNQLAYILYYEQGVLKTDSMTVFGQQSSSDVKEKSVFPSDLGMKDDSNPTRTLRLENKSGKWAHIVLFRLSDLRPFTPYKIWVRAFYNSSDNNTNISLEDRLGPQSEPLYVVTDVKPPSAPTILNLTCDQPKGLLYLQWRQPDTFNNSIDKYVVTLRKIADKHTTKLLKFPATKIDLEISIKEPLELWNSTHYEVKIYAMTLSIWQPKTFINGPETPPKEISSEWCMAHSEARVPALEQRNAMREVVLFAVVPIVVLVAAAILLIYWRCRSRLSKCISAAYNYLEEGGERVARAPLTSYKKQVVSCSPLRAGGGVGEGGGCVGSACEARCAPPPRMAGAHHPAVPARTFPHHVHALHADGDIGFSKEYEIVVAKSAALGHSSHHSHRPENRLKNRYLNITAYDHSRVCVSSGGRCGAAGCIGNGAGAGGVNGNSNGGNSVVCDYVNANFIDGMLPALDDTAKRRIRRKLEKRTRPARPPSVKPAKPPPNLTEGIESAFLNIEFSGIVESDELSEDTDSDRSDDDSELDDVYVDIDGVKTRVKLEWLIWKRRYIATQGPTPATLDAFWRMIWQHRVLTIVMITNLVERGRRKCDMYWPSGGRGSTVTFGGVRVTLLHEDVRAAYTVRHMRLEPQHANHSSQRESENSDGAGEGSSSRRSSDSGRMVVQYHYTVWPDHGTPRHPLAVLPFVKAAAADPATVLVHCSAGVGRTGTYIVLDAQLNQLKLTGTLSPLGFLCRARTQRNHLVQTEEQYVFVHDALLEHVRSGDTEVEFPKARQYLVKLLEDISEDELAVLDLNANRHKSVTDVSNVIENCETSSVKSSAKEFSEKDEALENGSQISIKTDDLSSELSKSVKEINSESQKEVMVNGDENEGMYDLAPRSTDTYSKKMQAYNNMTDQEKEEVRRVNRAENYALLERMRSLAGRQNSIVGPPPVNLLEKQFQLITRSCVPASPCARSAHNVDKNRPRGVLPSDAARVMLVPKPGVEGSEYVNASWVCGRRRLREYAVAQHPPPSASAAADLWRLLWDHTAQLVLTLSDLNDPECELFWPTEDDKELFVANFRASFISKETYVAYRKSDRKSTISSPAEPEMNGYRRQESECADDERLIPENGSPISNTEPSYRFDRTSLRLERLSAGNRDLAARKSIANGDLFSSLSETRKSGPKSPRSPSKMSLKNFKLSSPTKFKFPDWGSKTAGSPPDTAPPPPPVAPLLSVEEETQLKRPCYTFERVNQIPDNIPSDRIIEVTNVSVHSLQEDYQLSVKFIKCSGWLNSVNCDYTVGRPDNNECVKAIRQAVSESDREEAINRLVEPYKDSFALIEFVAGSQMEYKNGPVVVVDKYGGWKPMSFCALSAACGGARDPDIADPAAAFHSPLNERASLYCCWALAAHARCADTDVERERAYTVAERSHTQVERAHTQAERAHSHIERTHTHVERAEAHSAHALLACYCALAAYGPMLHERYTAHR